MNKNKKQINISKKKGFTLVETMVAVFILTLTLSTLLTITASSIFDSRYAKNEIIANYLLQEAVDYIRNDRDTIAFQHDGGGDWNSFLNKYGYNGGSGPDTCFVSSLTAPTSGGCYIEPVDPSLVPTTCGNNVTFGISQCPIFYFDENASHRNFANNSTLNNFYTYRNTDSSGNALPSSNFKRQITMKISDTNPDELDVKVTLEWLNGNLTRKRSLQLSLLNWQS